MTQPWKTIVVTSLVIVFSVASCHQDAAPVPPITLRPTWTPTTLPAPDLKKLERTPVVAISPDSTPVTLGTLAQTTPKPKPAVQREIIEEEATETDPKAFALSSSAQKTPMIPPAASEDGRIDVAGPVAITTVEPLAPGAGMPPARLLIPSLNLDAPVQPMSWKVIEDSQGVRSEWEVVDFAAGHHINSAFPGEAGNVVLSGHNNIGGAVFQSVCVIGEPGVDFELGDEMILVDEIGNRFIYQVNGWRRLEEANASIYQRQENAQYLDPTTVAQLTLITCWPPNSNTHRVIVTGVLSGMEQHDAH